MDKELQARRDSGLKIVQTAADAALTYFRDIGKLVIEQKGKQDLVSDADRAVELIIREALLNTFPDDGIIGEEHGRIASKSGYTWVIDPIDGTASFVAGMPGWCVVLACVYKDKAALAVIIDPVAQETFLATKGGGATLNDQPLKVSNSQSLAEGSVAVGYAARADHTSTVQVLEKIMQAGGIFFRCGSGALMLCYVAAGRLIGYCETHMHPWDCIAALLIIEEAGGIVEPFDTGTMLAEGGRVLTACPGVYAQLEAICLEAAL